MSQYAHISRGGFGVGRFVSEAGKVRRTSALSEIVSVDHCYSKPWNAHPDASHAKPVKVLFATRSTKTPITPTFGSDVDVVTYIPSKVISVDQEKANQLMLESSHHVSFARREDIGENWEERLSRTSWSIPQNRLFNKVVKALTSDLLARTAFVGMPMGITLRRNHIDKTSRKIRQAYSGVMWNMQICQWLHAILFSNLSNSLLAIYLDVLQTLKSKIPHLIMKMMAGTAASSPPASIEALDLFLKRPWDPIHALTTNPKLRKLPGNPLLVLAPRGPTRIGTMQSKRSRFWMSQLSCLGKVVTVSIHTSNGHTTISTSQCIERMLSAVWTKVSELKSQFPGRPIVLVGWQIGALISLHVALYEYVTAVLCLGIPLSTISGSHGDADDKLLDVTVPSLFVVGEMATRCSVDQVEEFREKMKAENSLLVVGGADDLLRMCSSCKQQHGMTQTMVDRKVLGEISEFLGGVIASSNTSDAIEPDYRIKKSKKSRQKISKQQSQSLMPSSSGLAFPSISPNTKYQLLSSPMGTKRKIVRDFKYKKARSNSLSNFSSGTVHTNLTGLKIPKSSMGQAQEVTPLIARHATTSLFLNSSTDKDSTIDKVTNETNPTLMSSQSHLTAAALSLTVSPPIPSSSSMLTSATISPLPIQAGFNSLLKSNQLPSSS